MYRHLEYKTEDRVKFVNVWNAESLALHANDKMMRNSAVYMKDEIEKLLVDKKEHNGGE